MLAYRVIVGSARICRRLETLCNASAVSRKTAFSSPCRPLFISHKMYVDEGKKFENTNNQSESKTQACEEDIHDVKSEIMEHALKHVFDYGWSKKAISLGAEDAGYSSAAEGMFVNEGCDLVMYFVRQSNQKLLNYLKEKVEQDKQNEEKIDVNVFLRDALEFRLRLIIPYVNVWAEAMKLLLSPSILNQSMDELSKMVDDIWYYAGDRSTNVEWYAKRGFLAQLFGGLQLVMLTDQSSDYKDTWTFLNRRFKDMQTLKELTEGFEKNGENMANILKNFNVFKNKRK